MRNPETSKLIKNAMDSPVGSTHRQKAKKVFSIMSKLNASHDGMGGPGMMYDQMAHGEMPDQQAVPIEVNGDNSKGMVIFHKIPTPKINYGEARPKANVHDGAGGPGDNPFNMSNPYNQPAMTPNMSTAQGPAYRAPDGTITYMNQQPAPVSTPAPQPPAYDDTPPIVRMFQDPGAYFQRVQKNLTPPTMSQQIKNSLVLQKQDQAYRNSIGDAPILKDLGNLWNMMNPPTKDSQGNPFHPNDNFDPQGNPLPGFDDNGNPLPGYNANGQKIDQSNGVSQSYIDDAKKASGVNADGTYQGPYAPQTSTPPGGGSSAPGSGTTGVGNAALNVANFLKVSPDTPLTSIKVADLMQAIAANEGFTSGTSKPAIANNNPGNLKFMGQAGATKGTASSENDGSYYAKFSTVAAGWQALQNDLNAKMASGKYNTLADMMNVYSPNSGGGTGSGTGLAGGSSTTGGKPTGLAASALDAVSKNMGPGMFAFSQLMDPNDPVTHGQTLGQENKSIWDKYGITGLQTKMNQLEYEGATLPQDVAGYISARDQYLKQTDANIDAYINTDMKNMDTSDPVNFQKAQSHLNYLYTLRGRQNQSYIGYLTTAVNQHQADLNNITNQYSTALNAYQTDVTNNKADYATYAQALSDMYTAVDGAPLKAQQAQLYAAQILSANATAAADAAKLTGQSNYLDDYKKLQGHIVDNNGIIMPGLDLVKEVQDFSALDPSINGINIIQAYTEGVANYLSAPDEKTSTTGTGVTSAGKTKQGEDAITQFAHLAQAYADNSNMVTVAKASASDIAKRLAAHVGGTIAAAGKAPQLMAAVKKLSPSGFFASKTPPTQSQFQKIVTDLTKDPNDTTIADEIYQVFQNYVSGGSSPLGVVNGLLYPSGSTTQWSDTSPFDTKNPYSTSQFAQNIGLIYASNLLVSQGLVATQ